MELLLAPSCGPCGGQEVNVDEHTSRPETSAVPASHVLQEILRSDSLLGTTDVPTQGVMLSPLMKNGSSLYADTE